MLFILSSELPQQGKDTTCDYLNGNYNVTRVAIADSLKEICKKGGWDGEKDERGRQLLIDVGMTFRKYDENIWINNAISQIKKLIKEGHAVCITDCRFKNEIDILRASFTRTPMLHIGISSDELGDLSRKDDSSQKDFELMEFDYTIKTTKNLNDLYKQIDEIVSDYNNKYGL